MLASRRTDEPFGLWGGFLTIQSRMGDLPLVLVFAAIVAIIAVVTVVTVVATIIVSASVVPRIAAARTVVVAAATIVSAVAVTAAVAVTVPAVSVAAVIIEDADRTRVDVAVARVGTDDRDAFTGL